MKTLLFIYILGIHCRADVISHTPSSFCDSEGNMAFMLSKSSERYVLFINPEQQKTWKNNFLSHLKDSDYIAGVLVLKKKIWAVSIRGSLLRISLDGNVEEQWEKLLPENVVIMFDVGADKLAVVVMVWDQVQNKFIKKIAIVTMHPDLKVSDIFQSYGNALPFCQDKMLFVLIENTITKVYPK